MTRAEARQDNARIEAMQVAAGQFIRWRERREREIAASRSAAEQPAGETRGSQVRRPNRK